MNIQILPKEIISRSLSKKEIILNYEDSLKALDILLESNIALLGWEGWSKYPDGSVGHNDYQGTESINRKVGESWDNYAKRGYNFVKKTIQESYEDWIKSPQVKEYKLYFCITPISKIK